MINETPLVSVIVPVYNSQDYIEECLYSIITQTYKNFEIIIVDDGSTDLTMTIINKIYQDEQDVKIVVVKQNNSGPSAARNHGIRLSHGDYIAFLDSDDQWYPNKLERILSELKKDKSIDVISSLYSIGEKTKYKQTDGSISYFSLYKLLFKNVLLTSGVVCRANLFKEIKFNEGQKYSEDYRLWLEMAASGYKCVVVNDCLLRMNAKPIYGASGLSSRLWQMEKGELSNFIHLYKSGKISLIVFTAASLFSFLKYVRRVVIVKYCNYL